MRTGLLLAASLLLVVGCGDEADDELLVESTTSETRFVEDGAMTMVAGVLDRLELDRGMVVAPTDQAIFALDADALADLLAGGLDELVARSTISIDYGASIEDWPGQLGDGSGPEWSVDRSGDTWKIDGHPIVDVWQRDRVTVVVIDGVLER